MLNQNFLWKPTIFGYVDAVDSEPVNFWINKGSMDNFHLIMPKSWDMLIRAYRVNWRHYTLTASFDPESIIKRTQVYHFLSLNIFCKKIFLV